MTTNVTDKTREYIRTLKVSLTVSMFLALWGCASAPDQQKQRMVISTVNFNDPLLAEMGYAIEAPQARIYKDPDVELSLFRKYVFDYGSHENPLLEKELLKMLEGVLSQKGMVKDESSPDVLITMNFYVGRKEKYVPPKTITTTRIENVWSTGIIGMTLTGQATPVPITESQTTPGHTEVSYYKNIRLNMLDYVKLKSGEKLKTPPVLWMGEVEAAGKEPDIRNVASRMLDELFYGPLGKIKIGSLQMEGCLWNKTFVIRSVHAAGRPVDINAQDIIRTINGVAPVHYIYRNREMLPASISGPGNVISYDPLTANRYVTSGYSIQGNVVELEVENPSTKTVRKVLVK